ncbi:MAG: hypothetical protein BWK79_08515, partial [Beggiatoa sp. IS2]
MLSKIFKSLWKMMTSLVSDIFPILHLLIVLMTLLFGQNVQAVLSAGDIAFVQYNADGTDNFAFVALVDIPAGETINFTDNGWKSDNTWNNTEGIMVWVAPSSGIIAGTRVRPSISNISLSMSGDQLIAYQGTNT